MVVFSQNASNKGDDDEYHDGTNRNNIASQAE